MRNLLFTTALIWMAFAASAQNLPADKIIGVWFSEDSDVKLKFEIYRSEGKYFGKLLWASTMFEADGKTPKKDPKNPDKNFAKQISTEHRQSS
ncbi:MAG: DUF2147 domain-containing protein [Pseudosphingobacterium sp.]|nr:DUF2147 domain-containing protein [Olivibacter sp. UJ_SKK_5.1]MDX3915489.1 DUF2147 domain-containing protein [Pseudosphingobacterium sp.]